MASLIRASITIEFFLAVVLMDPPRSLTLLTTGIVHPRFFQACCWYHFLAQALFVNMKDLAGATLAPMSCKI